jgi:hypothetical protein
MLRIKYFKNKEGDIQWRAGPAKIFVQTFVWA